MLLGKRSRVWAAVPAGVLRLHQAKAQQLRTCRARDELEKMLEQAAEESVRNPLPIDAKRIRKEEFRRQREEAATQRGSSGLDKLLGAVGITPPTGQDKRWPPPDTRGEEDKRAQAEADAASDLPDFMRSSTALDQPLDSDGVDLTAPVGDLPAFMRRKPTSPPAAATPEQQPEPSTASTPASAPSPPLEASSTPAGAAGGKAVVGASSPAAKTPVLPKEKQARLHSLNVEPEVPGAEAFGEEPLDYRRTETEVAKTAASSPSSSSSPSPSRPPPQSAPLRVRPKREVTKLRGGLTSLDLMPDEDMDDIDDDDVPEFLRAPKVRGGESAEGAAPEPAPAQEQTVWRSVRTEAYPHAPKSEAPADGDNALPAFLRGTPADGEARKLPGKTTSINLPDGIVEDEEVLEPPRRSPAAAETRDDRRQRPQQDERQKPPASADDDSDLPAFLRGTSSAAAVETRDDRRQRPSTDDDSELPSFLRGTSSAAAVETREDRRQRPQQDERQKPPASTDDDSDLPAFLRGTSSAAAAETRDDRRQRPQQEERQKPPASTDDDSDLPPFLRGTSSAAAESKARLEADLPPFLRSAGAGPSRGGRADDDESLPPFLRTAAVGAASDTAATRQQQGGRPSHDDGRTKDSARKQEPAGKAEVPKQAAAAKVAAQDDDKDWPSFLKNDDADAGDDDDLPSFLRADPKPSPGAAQKAQQASKTGAASAAGDDSLPAFLKGDSKPQPKGTQGGKGVGGNEWAEDADDDLPAFLKGDGGSAKAKQGSNDDDSLPAFLKRDPKPQSKGTPSPQDSNRVGADEWVDDADDADDDLPAFLKSDAGPAKAKQSSGGDDSLPAFLKGDPKPQSKGTPSPQGGKRVGADEWAADADDADDDLPAFLKNGGGSAGDAKSQAKDKGGRTVGGNEGADDADDDLPAFLKPGGGAAKLGGDEDDDDDLPAFLRDPKPAAPQRNGAPPPAGGRRWPPAEDAEDDLPAFLKEDNGSPRRGRNSGGNGNDDDDDLPAFLKGNQGPGDGPRPGTAGGPGKKEGRGRPAAPSSDNGLDDVGGDELLSFLEDEGGELDDAQTARGAKDEQKPSGRPANDDRDEDGLPAFLRGNKQPAAAVRRGEARASEKGDDVDVPAFLKAGSAGKGGLEETDDDDDDLPSFLRGRRGSGKTGRRVGGDDDELPAFLKGGAAAPKGGQGIAPARHDGEVDSDLPAFLRNEARTPKGVLKAEGGNPAGLEAPARRDDDDDNDLPAFLRNDTSAPNGALKAQGSRVASNEAPARREDDDDNDLPAFLRTEAAPSSKGAAKASEGSSLGLDDDDLPAFLKTAAAKRSDSHARGPGVTEGADELPEFLRPDGANLQHEQQQQQQQPPKPEGGRGMHPARLAAIRSKGTGEQPFVSSAQVRLPLGDVGEAMPPKLVKAADADRPPFLRSVTEDDDELPEFLKGFGKDMNRGENLPEFLRNANRPQAASKRQPAKADYYDPPPHVPRPRGPAVHSVKDDECTKRVKILDDVTIEPLDGQSWEGVRSALSAKEGKVAFGIHVLWGRLCRLGWSIADSTIDLGTAAGGYGYGATGKKSTNREFSDYGKHFSAGDTVLALVDFGAREISFTCNGEDLGKAFDVTTQAPLHPHVLTKTARVEIYYEAQPGVDLPAGYKWISGLASPKQAAPKTASKVPSKTCALCSQERIVEEMEEMGGGSGFYRCRDGRQNESCAPERTGARPRQQQQQEQQQPDKVRPPVSGSDFARRATNALSRSYQGRTDGKHGTSWRDRASSTGVPKQRCRDCWSLIPEASLLTDGNGIWYCDPSKEKPCSSLTDAEKNEAKQFKTGDNKHVISW
ncbi:putative ATP-dependent RNA helicase ddx1 [Diplonema papillatum]|nr:putative ATP-dependent RNA helicase ddx1 [Diplonema papillatum]